MGGLLRALAAFVADGKVAEVGTGYGVGTAWLAAGLSGGAHLFTVDNDPERVRAVRRLYAREHAVTVLEGDWHTMLAPLLPFDLLFLDGGGHKRDAPTELRLARRLLRPGGLLVIDDMTPGFRGPDPVRDHLTPEEGFVACELLTTPRTALIVAARVEPRP